MNGEVLKAKVHEWAKKVGPMRARVALVNAQIGLSTAQKLVAGTYAPIPRGETAFRLQQLLIAEGLIKPAA